MKICIIGSTFAPKTFRKAWAAFFTIVQKPEDADLVFISKDTAIAEDGKREQESIRQLVEGIYPKCRGPLILTSQVEPGFTRSLNLPIYHLAETLRIKDAPQRALKPDYFALGCPTLPVEVSNGVHHYHEIPYAIKHFFTHFDAEVIYCTWEEAEFSKIAVNMTLASQVENTNRLAQAAKTVGADWKRIAYILGKDKRIGDQSYLTPGRWQDSQHLLRDSYTLKEIENG